MTESIADKQRREAALAEALLPRIVEGLQRGEAALDIARRLADELSEDSDGPSLAHGPKPELKTIYRWVTIVEERLDSKRRRVGLLAAGLLWLGFAGGAAGALRLTLGVPIPAPAVFIGAGALFVIAGVLVWRFGKRRVVVSADEIIG